MGWILGTAVSVEVARTGSLSLKQFCPVIKTTFPHLSGIVSKVKNKPRSTRCLEKKVLLTSHVVCPASRFLLHLANRVSQTGTSLVQDLPLGLHP